MARFYMLRRDATRLEQFHTETIMEVKVNGTFSAMCYGTKQAIHRLKDGKQGDEITPGEMTDVIGKDCRTNPGYGNVQTAIRHVQNNYSVCWRWVKSQQAYRCLTDAERVTLETQENAKARRAARRGLKVAATVNIQNLSAEQKRDHDLNVFAAGLADVSCSGAFRKRLDESESKLVQPDKEKLLELMKS